MKYIIVLITLLMFPTLVFAKGSFSSGRSFSSSSRSFSSSSRSFSSTPKSTAKSFTTTPKSAPKVSTPKSSSTSKSSSTPKSNVNSKPAPKSTTTQTTRTVVYHTYTPVGYGSWSPFDGNFWMWMYIFNRPQTVVQAQPVQNPQPTPSIFCDKQWWQFWRVFEKC